MSLKLKISIFTAAFCLFMTAASASAQIGAPAKENKTEEKNKTEKSAQPSPTPEVKKAQTKKTEIVLPEIENWEKSEISKYPTPELGYSVNYESDEAGRVTVYVYNNGLKKISNDLEDKTVKAEMKNAKDGIYQFEEAGYYQDVTELKNETVTLGGAAGKVKSLHATFTFKAGGKNLTSEVYLFVYQNNFIKLRATRPLTLKDDSKGAMTTLLSELDKVFSN